MNSIIVRNHLLYGGFSAIREFPLQKGESGVCGTGERIRPMLRPAPHRSYNEFVLGSLSLTRMAVFPPYVNSRSRRENLEFAALECALDLCSALLRIGHIVITTKEGSEVRTFDLKYERKKEAIKKAMLTDGMWMLITNIMETTEPEELRLSPKKLIGAYRDKNKVEEGFREVKYLLKFRPTFVYTDDHVRAHYTICILGYLLDVTVTNRLREAPVGDVGM